MSSNKLILNTTESHYMLFHKSHNKSKEERFISLNNNLKHIRTITFLSELVDDKLSAAHINYNYTESHC